MRFVRYYTRADTGEIVAVAEQETPFDDAPNFQPPGIAIEIHDLGLVEDFTPTTLSGERCLPSAHLFERLESDGAGSWRAKPGHALPPVLDCPATMNGIRQRLRERGAAGLPSKARAWLTLMLPDDEVAALGVTAGISLPALKALDAMRARRDPTVGSRASELDRKKGKP